MTEWHAVRAKIGAEGRALIGIEAAGMGAYLPIELIRKNHRGEREIIWRPLFPRYLFAAIDPGRDLAGGPRVPGSSITRGRQPASRRATPCAWLMVRLQALSPASDLPGPGTAFRSWWISSTS
jgi:Transcription termination factor nusG